MKKPKIAVTMQDNEKIFMVFNSSKKCLRKNLRNMKRTIYKEACTKYSYPTVKLIKVKKTGLFEYLANWYVQDNIPIKCAPLLDNNITN